jgi:cytochrome c
MFRTWKRQTVRLPCNDEDIMKTFILLTATVAALGAPAVAGDPAAGEDGFKKCKACHSIIAPDGTEIQKGGRTGPNLYGVVGRGVASDPDFSYGDGIAALGATGAVWDEAGLAAYVADPGAYLKGALGDDGAKSKMSFKLASGGEDVAAYLASVAQ